MKYLTIEKSASAIFKEKGSRFVGYAFPAKNTTDIKTHLQAIKKEHPKATHHCFAYRFGTSHLQFRSSDDGEPAGSAGKPILNQLQSRQLTDVLLIVVRYFGGTLLGVPGLINAYKTTAALVLQLVPIIEKNVEILYELKFDYTRLNDVLECMWQYDCTTYNRELQLFCSIRSGIPLENETACIAKLQEINNIEIIPLAHAPAKHI